jgi:two-component system, LytTR family, sensor kinase
VTNVTAWRTRSTACRSTVHARPDWDTGNLTGIYAATMGLWIAGVGVIVTAALLFSFRYATHAKHAFGTSDERNTYFVLETAEEAARAFQGGFTSAAAEKGIGPLRGLLGVPVLAIHDAADCLAVDGDAHSHLERLRAPINAVLASGRSRVVTPPDVSCGKSDCNLHSVVIAPVSVGDAVVGAIVALTGETSPALLRATESVARWVSVQIELNELHQSKARLAESELRFLRAQISPHFIYNALTAIASFVRSDPPRARELLLDFADFTRYSFASHGQFTTLSDELLSIERYLRLEHARFGDRLTITLRVEPEVLPVAVPFLVLQPLVENAIRHGIERKVGQGRITITAEDQASHCVLSIEDDGVGMDPARLREQFAGNNEADRVGLANVDERLRSIYGQEYGLTVETAPEAGTKITVRIPKFRPGVRPS